jgi:hypothetical protein
VASLRNMSGERKSRKGTLMSYRTIASVAAAALIGIACVSTDALARGGRGGGGRVGSVHHAGAYHGVHHGGAYVRRGVGAAAVGVGAAAVGGAIYNSRAQCGYYPYPPCY